MELVRGNEELEALNKELNDPERLRAYAAVYGQYRPAFLPRLFGGLMVRSGNFLYGREPSYLKFRAVEVIARVPYHSWASAAYTLGTFFYKDDARGRHVPTGARRGTRRFYAPHRYTHVVRVLLFLVVVRAVSAQPPLLLRAQLPV